MQGFIFQILLFGFMLRVSKYDRSNWTESCLIYYGSILSDAGYK